MPSEDYGSVSRGALKIKGVEGSKIEKHKKKQKPKREKKAKLEDPKSDESKLPGSAEKQQKLLDDALADEDENDQQDIGPGSAMTDAERHSYERRYKMV